MAVAENAGVKVDSSAAQNLDNNNNTADSSSLDSSDPPTPDSDDRTDQIPQKDETQTSPNGERGGSLNKSEIKDLSDAFSKLNPMAKEFVPRTQSGGGLGFTNNFADGSDHLARRRRSFGQEEKDEEKNQLGSEGRSHHKKNPTNNLQFLDCP